MDQTALAELNAKMDAAARSLERRVRGYAKARGIPAHHARPIVSAMVSVEQLSSFVAKQLAGTPGRTALERATRISGGAGKDWEQVEEHGVARWILARAYLTLRNVEGEVRSDNLIYAVSTVARVASSLVFAMEVLSKEQKASAGSKGGKAAAAVTREIRAYAERLAREQMPSGGWSSAPQAAGAIQDALRRFARERGRNPSARKVAEWLREAGIKRRKGT